MIVKVILFTLFAIASAQPQGDAIITKYNFENTNDGGYSYTWETSNGIHRNEEYSINDAGKENEVIKVKGSYSYIGNDGKLYEIFYNADENGFKASGSHLPNSAGVEKLKKPSIPPPGVKRISPAALASLAGGGIG